MPASGAAILTDAAYFVWSAGKDHKGAPLYSTAATPVACGASTNLDVENCDDDDVFRDAPFNNGEVAAQFFDDQTSWVAKFHLSAISSSSDTLWAANGDANLYSVGTDGNRANTNVGIGTDVPASKLEVISDAYPVVRSVRETSFTDDVYHSLAIQQRTTGNMIDGFGTGLVFELQDSSGVLNEMARLQVRRDGADDSGSMRVMVHDNTDGWTSALYVKSNGNVGIRESDPEAPLQVAGNVVIGSLAAGAKLQVHGHDDISGVGSGGNLILGPAGTGDQMMRIDPNEIQTTTNSGASSGKLTINKFGGDVAIGGDGLGAAGPVLTIESNNNIDSRNSGGNIVIMNGTRRLRLDPNAIQTFDSGVETLKINEFGGDIRMGTDDGGKRVVLYVKGPSQNCKIGDGGGANCSSDRRQKMNIEPLTGDLAKLANITGQTFEWKKNPGKRQIGLIAQDVQKEYPLAVTTEEDGDKLLLSETSLIAPLINATHELSARDDALAARIDALSPHGIGEAGLRSQWPLFAGSFLMGMLGMLIGYRLGRRAS